MKAIQFTIIVWLISLLLGSLLLITYIELNIKEPFSDAFFKSLWDAISSYFDILFISLFTSIPALLIVALINFYLFKLSLTSFPKKAVTVLTITILVITTDIFLSHGTYSIRTFFVNDYKQLDYLILPYWFAAMIGVIIIKIEPKKLLDSAINNIEKE